MFFLAIRESDSEDEDTPEKLLAWKVFAEAGVSDPELEIAVCLAPQLSVDSLNPDSHFMEDLGADSEDFGRMISQTRSTLSLQKIDLQILSEHPTVRSLAACFSLRSAQSDSGDEDKVSHQSLSYLQLSGDFGADFGADSLMGKTWDRGKTVSDKKFSHNIIDNSKAPQSLWMRLSSSR